MIEWIVRLQPVSLIIGSLFGFMLMKRKMKNESVPYEKMMDAVTNAFYHHICMEICTGNFKSSMGY